MKIRMNVEGRSIAATLADNDTARDFASLLPLDLTLTDYAATEKISDLPRRLSTDDAPAGIDPSARDLAYYSPWGNLAVFYKDGHYSRGLVTLGRIDSGLEALNRRGPLRVTVELVERQNHWTRGRRAMDRRTAPRGPFASNPGERSSGTPAVPRADCFPAVLVSC